MYVNRRKTLGIVVPVLLVSATAVTAISLTARAQTYQDTSLSAGAVSDDTFGGTGLSVTNGTDVIDLNGTGVTWSLHGTVTGGVSLTGGDTITYTGSAVASPPEIVADATDSAGNAVAYEIPVTIGDDTITTSGATKVSLSGLDDTNTNGTVEFSAASSKNGDSITYAESDLPAGLTSANPLTYSGGTAAPGSYNGVDASATDSDGAVLNGTFTLTVSANTVSGTNTGDYVNNFGNGFDSFRQHEYAGAVIAGWPATQSDPATHFILNEGTHSGAYQIEYAPSGTATGLCVSDPGGGWASDPLPDGLILANCNTGPWQQFIPQPDGTLKNVATSLYVNPDGKGAQLRGEVSPTSWGGSAYTWTAEGNLPG